MSASICVRVSSSTISPSTTASAVARSSTGRPSPRWSSPMVTRHRCGRGRTISTPANTSSGNGRTRLSSGVTASAISPICRRGWRTTSANLGRSRTASACTRRTRRSWPNIRTCGRVSPTLGATAASSSRSSPRSATTTTASTGTSTSTGRSSSRPRPPASSSPRRCRTGRRTSPRRSRPVSVPRSTSISSVLDSTSPSTTASAGSRRRTWCVCRSRRTIRAATPSAGPEPFWQPSQLHNEMRISRRRGPGW